MTRSRAAARDAGTWLERVTAEYLAEALHDDRIERRTKHGVKDRGDIGGVRTALGERVVIECKNVAKRNLKGWLREAEVERGNDDAAIGVVVHKMTGSRIPGEQYVTMSLRSLAVLLGGETAS